MKSIFSDAVAGLGFLGRGARVLVTRPRLAVLGMVPPLFVSAVMITLLLLLGFLWLGPLTEAVTGWAPESIRAAVRVLIGIAVMAVALVIAVVVFVSVTLIVGAPIYERISIEVERGLGLRRAEAAETPVAGALRSIRQSILLVLFSGLAGLAVFLLGLIPVAGPILGLVAGALVGGFFLVTEMISGPFDRWGRRRLREKFGAVNTARAKTLGFGLPVFLLFSVPMIAVLVFPAATAGATLLAYDLDADAGRG